MILNFIMSKVGNPPCLYALCGAVDPIFAAIMNENGMTISSYMVFRQTIGSSIYKRANLVH